MILLRGKLTQRLLSYLFLHEEESFYINQLAKELELDKGNLIKKLRELSEAGLLQDEFRGRQRYYFLNKKYPLYQEYQKIFQKTLGFEKQLSNLLRKISGIKKAWLFGSYATNKMDASSDVDLLIVGEHSNLSLYKELAKMQKILGREINSVSMSPEEFKKRQKKKDPFLENVFKGKVLPLS